MEFHLVNVSPTDNMRSRVRLHPTVWQTLKLSQYGAPVAVSLPHATVFATAWPLTGDSSNTVTLDTSNAHSERESWTAPASLPLSAFKVHSKPKALQKITLLLSPAVSTMSDSELPSHGDLVAATPQLLWRVPLCRGCVIKRHVNNVPCSFEVLATEPPSTPDQPFILGSATEIQFVPVKTAAPLDVDASDDRAVDDFDALCSLVRLPLSHGQVFEHLALDCPTGILLHGPPGVGKTYLVKQVATACSAQLISVRGPECLSPYLGESEKNVRDVFKRAASVASRQACILFIDEIDALCPKRTEGQTHEARVVAQLLTLMDGLSARGNLVVIGATNRPNAIDGALRRPGRFDREINLRPPDEAKKLQILRSRCEYLPLASDVELDSVAHRCIGYVGADLAALIRHAALAAMERQLEDEQSHVQVEQADFELALAQVQPSTKRANQVRVRGANWEDVGGLQEVKLALKQAVEWPLKHPETFRRLGLSKASGVLLYGPPGCSKTTLVRVIATACSATFLTINGAQLYSPYVGDAEATLREVFRQARLASPSVLFLDEVDALVGKRGASAGEAGSSQARVLSTLLNEMDGIEQGGNVLVVAATNRPDMLDAAFLRPGRMDKIIYVPPPDPETRSEILRVHTRKMPLGDVDFDGLIDRTHNYSGADLESLCKEAAVCALREDIEAGTVAQRHFEAAFKKVLGSISEDQLEFYRNYRLRDQTAT